MSDHSTCTEVREHQRPQVDAPARRLIAAGVKRGSGPLTITPVMSAADRERYTARCYGLWAAATNFRRYVKAVV